MIEEQPAVWEPQPLTDPRVDVALDELRSLILQHYPYAVFDVMRVEDMGGLWLTATQDIEDSDGVMDIVIDRLLEMQVEERLLVHVLPLRTHERIAKMSAEGKFGPHHLPKAAVAS